jgi:hypothetical protein
MFYRGLQKTNLSAHTDLYLELKSSYLQLNLPQAKSNVMVWWFN